MKYLRTFALLVLSWIVLVGLVSWLGFWIGLSVYLVLASGIGVAISFFPQYFIKTEPDPPVVDSTYSTPFLEVLGYLEERFPEHRIFRRVDSYGSKKYLTTRTLLYSHSLTLQDWVEVIEFFDLDKQGWQIYTGRNGSYGIKKYERG